MTLLVVVLRLCRCSSIVLRSRGHAPGHRALKCGRIAADNGVPDQGPGSASHSVVIGGVVTGGQGGGPCSLRANGSERVQHAGGRARPPRPGGVRGGSLGRLTSNPGDHGLLWRG